jgi:peptidyl-prolyl cis-trans isomerase C
MKLSVNGATIPPDAIARELILHDDAADPEAAARRTLAVRELLLQRARDIGMLDGVPPAGHATFDERERQDAVIGRLLEREVSLPQPSIDECRRFYEMHPERYTSGDRVEARHILFAITPATPVMALRDCAERVLAEVGAAPESFGARARELSNCPSGEHGGQLGQFGRGEMVPEFDQAVFGTQAVGVLPTLVASRHGFHIVAVDRRMPGRQLPFALVADRVADYLAARVEERALKQYVEMLAGRADIVGADLAGSAGPLVQ